MHQVIDPTTHIDRLKKSAVRLEYCTWKIARLYLVGYMLRMNWVSARV